MSTEGVVATMHTSNDPFFIAVLGLLGLFGVIVILKLVVLEVGHLIKLIQNALREMKG